MEKLNVAYFVNDAREKLEGRGANRMAAIHTGVIVAVGLVLTVVQMMLSESMGKATGLSGLGTVSLLQTAQTVLQWANTLLVPFWNLGFLYVALQWARSSGAADRDLLTGFQRIGPCIGLLLNRFLICFGVMFLTVNICSTAYMATPAGTQLMEMITAAGGDMNAIYEMSEAQMTELMASMTPMLIIWGILCILLLVPILYRFRLAEYAILDYPGIRALPAMILSAGLLRRRCWQLFKLDLRFWWYYGLKLLCMLVCYADVLLSAAGVILPVEADVIFIVTYIAYLALLFGVEACFRPRVETAYACAYDALKEMGPALRKTASATPRNLPRDTE